ncbi:hypothetical protein GOP47_0007752 [Adiantum capillus-veneris]|uniref:Nitrate regulatory gene2 protein n=1 Tax=Adiantum capillus-veneris TaxID=13818 RepID=A0A9D4V272_ADICA|nr:hypothetical protein GOP47_0007752 [Adiantum capillus-veneris]
MGCINSKLRAEDVVGRCRARKRLIKQAVEQRHAFAAAHVAYSMALRSTGAALRQFAEEEGAFSALAGQRIGGPLAASGTSIPELPPPPPPPLLFHDVDTTFSSAQTTDEASPSQPLPTTTTTCTSPARNRLEELPISTPPAPSIITSDHHIAQQLAISNCAPPIPVDVHHTCLTADEYHDEQAALPEGVADLRNLDEFSCSDMLRLSTVKKDLPQIAREVDEEFLKASAGGADVARTLETCHPQAAISGDLMLKARRNFKSAKVFSAFSWNWSRSALIQLGNRATNDLNDAKKGSHALTLERLAAWEKKLFEEVKVVEALRAEQHKKCSLLRRQEMRGEDAADIDKTRDEVKRLHSLILVCNHGIASTLEAIEDLRDDELHPQLVQLIAGLMNMWVTMHQSHARQTRIVVYIKNIDAAMSQEPTSKSHHQATIQLEKELLGWHESFCKLVASQRGYVSALYGWIKLSCIPIPTGKAQDKYSTEAGCDDDEDHGKEHDLQETYRLCEEWQRALACLPDRVATDAIKSLAEVVKAMVEKQGEEMTQRRKAEKLEKQWQKKVRALQPQVELEEEELAEEARGRRRRMRRRLRWEEGPVEEEEGGVVAGGMQVLMERKAVIAGMRKRIEGEMTKHYRAVQDTRVSTMNNLQTGLPGALEAMAGFSAVCSHAFQDLFSLITPC